MDTKVTPIGWYKMTSREIKVSSTGWLCIKRGTKWVPIFKLTDEQIRLWNIHKE